MKESSRLGFVGDMFAGTVQDKLFVLLACFFMVLYFPSVFLVVEDLGLIVGYEVDPGSHVAAIESLFDSPYYNMHGGYHSQYYGWSYFSLNFFLLAPVKFFLWLAGVDGGSLTYILVRFILFGIGLASVTVFYALAKRLFSNQLIAFFAAALYVVSPAGSSLFYFIHPETLGVMFLLLGVVFLLEFIDGAKKLKIYFSALIFLVLATLSKQVFFFLSLPVIFCFFHFHCKEIGKGYFEFVTSKDFYKLFGATILISLTVLFVIHPYAFFEFDKFIETQIFLASSFVDNKYAMSDGAALRAWYDMLYYIPFIVLSYLLFPVTGLVSFFVYIKTRKYEYFLYVISFIGVSFVLYMTIVNNRTLISPHYVQPLYPFFILNIFAVAIYVNKITHKFANVLKLLTNTLFYLFVICVLLSNLHALAPKLIERFWYKDSLAYQTYYYIKTNFTSTDKLAYDHYVALPSYMNSQGCHYWQGCGTDHIDDFNPNYVIFDEKQTVFQSGLISSETERLIKYVRDNDLKLIDTITARSQDAGNKEITVSIYKKIK